MTKPGTNQHQGGISTQKSTDDPRSPPDLTIHPLNYIIGTDLRPVFRRIITVGQRFFNASLHFLGGLRQLHLFQLCLLPHCFRGGASNSYKNSGRERIISLPHILTKNSVYHF
jgi:hypothetical protein